jgi:hypothetical protein
VAFTPEMCNAIILAHLDLAKKQAPEWEELRAMYRCGQMTAKNAADDGPVTESGALYAYCDSMTSAVVPPNPRVTCTPLRPALLSAARYREALVNDALERGDAARALWRLASHAAIYGRGVIKTVWNFDLRRPDFPVIDPRYFFFDQTASRWQDIRYAIEVVPMTKAEFATKVQPGPDGRPALYDGNVAARTQFSAFPEWLKDEASGRAEVSKALRQVFEWAPIFEFWDFTANPPRYYHFVADSKQPLLSDDPPYTFVRNPFRLLVFNDDLVGAGGIADAVIVRDPIRALDEVRSLKIRFAQASIPFNMVDERALDNPDEEKVKIAKGTGPWDLVGIKLKDGRSLGDSFGPSPTPHLVPALDQAEKALTEEILFRLGMPQYARGMTGTSDVATELALADAALRTRQGRRGEMVNQTVLFMASAVVGLYEEFLGPDEALPVRLGGAEFLEVSRAMMQSRDPDKTRAAEAAGQAPEEPLAIDYKVVPYSPVENSKVAQLRKLREFMPVLFGNPMVDQQKLIAKLVELIELGEDLVVAPQPTAPAPPGLPVAPSPLPGGPLPIQTEQEMAAKGGGLGFGGPEQASGAPAGALPGMAGGPGSPAAGARKL